MTLQRLIGRRGRFSAKLTNGIVFNCTFADYGVLRRWIDRPNFAFIPFTVLPEEYPKL